MSTPPRARILIVGAGLAGAVVARELAESGRYQIEIREARQHLGGNCYDPIDAQTGLRVHRYGPHIFHCRDQATIDWLSRFTDWLPYEHRVEALVAGVGPVPLPINRTTLNRLFGLKLRDETAMRAHLATLRSHHPQPRSAREQAENSFGPELTELFFGRYTRKMWGFDLDQLPASVLARLPIRYDDRRSYFDDPFQAFPAAGYEGLFARLLDHPAITWQLGRHHVAGEEQGYAHCFTSQPIDTWFDCCYGRLPWRSLRFHHERPAQHEQSVPTLNYTDTGPYTRITDWRLYPGNPRQAPPLLTREEPCADHENHFERYYPVRSLDGAAQELYQRYRTQADRLDHVTFIGRCGQYRYLDMHQVVANSRLIAQRFLAASQGD